MRALRLGAGREALANLEDASALADRLDELSPLSRTERGDLLRWTRSGPTEIWR